MAAPTTTAPEEQSPYRAAALKSMRRPDDLDEQLRANDPRAWIAVAAFAVVVVAAGIWAFVGSIPEHRTVPAVLERPGAVSTVIAPSAVVVGEMTVEPGDSVGAGEVIGTATDTNGAPVVLTSTGPGTVQEVAAGAGDQLAPGDRVAVVLDDTSTAPLTAITYVGAADAAAIRAGADVRVEPLASGASLDGVVDFVATLPADRDAVVIIVGNEELADALIAEAGGVPHLVRVSVPEPTGADDPPDGAAASMEITLGSQRPIDVLLGR